MMPVLIPASLFSPVYRKTAGSILVLFITMALILSLFSTGFNVVPGEPSDLPEGNSGVASRYPGDRNIKNDPAVLFADDFDQYSTVDDLSALWDILINEEHLIIDKDAGYGNKGNSLLITMPKRATPLSSGIAKLLPGTRDVLFLRWYSKFEEGWFIPGGSVHNGGSISSGYYENGRATPGVRADGRNKFLVNYENENRAGASPGHMNAYVYWPEQGDRFGDHFFPSGIVIPYSHERSGIKTFGDQFIQRPDFSPQTGRWYCYEYMVKANSPGKRDGRIALWLDGKLVADFPNLRLRDIDDLKIDRFDISIYIENNSARANRKWHDHVVAATSYIGPLVAK
jgi:hypothetical protein